MRPRRPSPAPSAGFTLVELLVAMGIMTMLGTALVLMLRQGIAAWRAGEARREVFEEADVILSQMREDVRSAATDNDHVPERAEVPVKLLSDYDDIYRQRLFLVRTIKGESENTMTGYAGSELGADASLDQIDDLRESEEGRLRALGGLMEVAWFMHPDGGDELWRAFNSPIGERGRSLFDQGATAPDADGRPPGSLVSDRVLWAEWLFWTQYTTTWDLGAPAPRKIPLPGDPEGAPFDFWDSTRGLIPPIEARPDPRLFHLWKDASSRSDPRDDVYPAKIRFTLTLREDHERAASTIAMDDVTDTAKEILLDDGGRLPPGPGWVRLGDAAATAAADAEGTDVDARPVGAVIEWIRYKEVNGNVLVVEDGGRGGRGTVPVRHKPGTPVDAGRTFTVIFDVPGHREDWND